MKTIKIETEYITLGQFLKAADIIATGGMAKRSYKSVIVTAEQIYFSPLASSTLKKRSQKWAVSD